MFCVGFRDFGGMAPQPWPGRSGEIAISSRIAGSAECRTAAASKCASSGRVTRPSDRRTHWGQARSTGQGDRKGSGKKNGVMDRGGTQVWLAEES